jgi:hypothetical protein
MHNKAKDVPHLVGPMRYKDGKSGRLFEKARTIIQGVDYDTLRTNLQSLANKSLPEKTLLKR